MLTNILLITLLVVLITNVYIMFKIADKSEKSISSNRTEILTNYKTMQEFYPLITIKTDNINSDNKQLLDIVGDIKEKILPRLEQQERLIAELKQNQAPEEVVETVNLLNEYLFGAKEE